MQESATLADARVDRPAPLRVRDFAPSDAAA